MPYRPGRGRQSPRKTIQGVFHGLSIRLFHGEAVVKSVVRLWETPEVKEDIMTAKTHIVGGILAAEALCLAMGVRDPSVALPCYAAAAIGALLPDIDHTDSKIAHANVLTRTVALVMSAVTRHRGFCHTPVFILVITALASGVAALAGFPTGWQLVAGCLCAGMLSHLALDTLNPMGIMWAWPVRRRRYSLAAIRTDSLAEWAVFAALLLPALLLIRVATLTA